MASRLPWVALGAFASIAVIVGVVAVVVHRIRFGDALSYPYLDGPSWLDALFQADSGWYYAIVDHGYSYTVGQQSSVAFFPAYPIAVLLVGSTLLHDDWSTAVGLTTLLAGGGLVVLFADWARRRLPARTAVVAVGVLLCYPYSFFLYGTGYSDAFYVFTALAAFVLLDRRHFVLATCTGIVATAGRPVGVAVVVGLAVRGVEMLAEARSDGPGHPPTARAVLSALPDVRWRQAILVMSGLGLVSWMVYLGARFGDPLAFLTVQGVPGWEQPGGPRTWFKVMLLDAVVLGRWGTVGLLVPQAVCAVIAVLLLRTVWRRLGWGYTAYAAVSLAIPIIGTKDFMGSGRYVLAAFPVLVGAAVYLCSEKRPRWQLPASFCLMLVGLVVATALYAAGVEVS